jgi:glycogen synthase
MTLKVLHVLDHSAPLHSGYTFRTLAILREQRKLGWQTLQLTTPKQGECSSDEETIDGFTFLRTRGAERAGLLGQMNATTARLRAAVERFEPDLIHAHSPVLTAFPSLRVARRYRLPVVYEVRATWEDAAVDNGSTTQGSLRYRLSKLLETFALRRVQHVTTICNGLRNEIVARGIAEHQITVIPNAVDVERFVYAPGSEPEARRELGLGQSATIGFIGSFYAYEGLDDLLRAMTLLSSSGVDVQAVLVGGGPEDANLRALAAELGIENRVRFVGRVDHERVQRYYRAIDVLVYPRKRTRLTELVTPLKPLEAMAQGNLVLASDVGGHRELIRDGDTGALFDADDVASLARAVQGLLESPEKWSHMRERGREFVTRERNWQLSASGYRHAYDVALKSKGRQSNVRGLGRRPPGTPS